MSSSKRQVLNVPTHEIIVNPFKPFNDWSRVCICLSLAYSSLRWSQITFVILRVIISMKMAIEIPTNRHVFTYVFPFFLVIFFNVFCLLYLFLEWSEYAVNDFNIDFVNFRWWGSNFFFFFWLSFVLVVVFSSLFYQLEFGFVRLWRKWAKVETWHA